MYKVWYPLALGGGVLGGGLNDLGVMHWHKWDHFKVGKSYQDKLVPVLNYIFQDEMVTGDG